MNESDERHQEVIHFISGAISLLSNIFTKEAKNGVYRLAIREHYKLVWEAVHDLYYLSMKGLYQMLHFLRRLTIF